MTVNTRIALVIGATAVLLSFNNCGGAFSTVSGGALNESSTTPPNQNPPPVSPPTTPPTGSNYTGPEFHVAISGSDATGDGSISHPWATPSYGAAHIPNGATLTIHAGDYVVSGNRKGWMAPIEMPPDTRVRANPGDTVVIDGGNTSPTGVVIANGGDNVTIQGLTIRGVVAMMGCTGCQTIDNDISIGGDGNTGNWGFGQLIEIEHCQNCLIAKNYLHDNADVISGNPLNSPSIQEYTSKNLIVENNEFANSGGPGLRLKDGPNNVTVRYNYFHDSALSCIQGANQDPGADVFIFQNIFEHCNTSHADENGAIGLSIDIQNVQIYNNTFVNNIAADIASVYGNTSTTWSAWNNIFYHSTMQNGIAIYYNGANPSFSDYNDFFGPTTFRNENSMGLSLVQWQINSKNDFHSISVDPVFVNAAAHDYHRTSYANDGRGGGFATVMGAYITGAELIGR